MRKKPEIKNYDDRWAEHCHSKLNSKNIAHMNGIVILFHPVCTHTHTQFQENTLYLHFFTHAIWNESWLKESAKHWRIKKRPQRTEMLDIILNECEFTIAMCFWNLLIAKEKTNNIREREREREWTEGVKKGDRKRRANNVKNQTGQHTHVCAEKDGRNAHS